MGERVCHPKLAKPGTHTKNIPSHLCIIPILEKRTHNNKIRWTYESALQIYTVALHSNITSLGKGVYLSIYHTYTYIFITFPQTNNTRNIGYQDRIDCKYLHVVNFCPPIFKVNQSLFTIDIIRL